ncbi:MAG TPA: flagellar export protein FliJ [Spirochaetota bacterium]|nr:flagellar export protein FliJ [Spirochaetota bacterium]
MKKFKFRLQRLLDIREAKEKGIKNEMAAVLTVQNRERRKQDQYRNSIEEQHIKFAELVKGGRYSYSAASSFERYIDFAYKVIRDQQERIDAMEPEIRKIRDRLVEASRERKVVEKLKQRHWDEFMFEYNREIAKENDDTNQNIFVKRRIEEMTLGSEA